MGMPAHQTKRWTLAELHRLPENDGNKYEVVRGELFVTPAPTVDHETIAARLARALDPYVERHGLGLVYRPRAVVRVRPHSEVEPDLMVRQAPARRGTSWDHAPTPILVIEILSDSTRRRDLADKRALYMEIGVPEYWVVDGGERRFHVIRPGGFEETVDHGAVLWHPRGVAAPLAVELASIFSTDGLEEA